MSPPGMTQGNLSSLLVNQTFRNPAKQDARALTRISLFHIMNKTRTLCGGFGSVLAAGGGARA
jgi:hypothetical protein